MYFIATGDVMAELPEERHNSFKVISSFSDIDHLDISPNSTYEFIEKDKIFVFEGQGSRTSNAWIWDFSQPDEGLNKNMYSLPNDGGYPRYKILSRGEGKPAFLLLANRYKKDYMTHGDYSTIVYSLGKSGRILEGAKLPGIRRLPLGLMIEGGTHYTTLTTASTLSETCLEYWSPDDQDAVWAQCISGKYRYPDKSSDSNTKDMSRFGGSIGNIPQGPNRSIIWLSLVEDGRSQFHILVKLISENGETIKQWRSPESLEWSKNVILDSGVFVQALSNNINKLSFLISTITSGREKDNPYYIVETNEFLKGFKPVVREVKQPFNIPCEISAAQANSGEIIVGCATPSKNTGHELWSLKTDALQFDKISLDVSWAKDNQVRNSHFHANNAGELFWFRSSYNPSDKTNKGKIELLELQSER